jgi:RNA polymerase sigma factor (sigma-70 family)
MTAQPHLAAVSDTDLNASVPSTGDDAAALARLVRRAAQGESRAWDELIVRFNPRLRAAARGFRLSAADVEDVVQTTWLAAFTHIDRIEKPEAIAGWLLVTARRAALRTLQRTAREVVTDEPPAPREPEPDSPATALIEAERRDAVRSAVRRLPDRQRPLVDALLTPAGTSYVAVSQRLGMPLGSIGPTRGRVIARLRRDPELAAVMSA